MTRLTLTLVVTIGAALLIVGSASAGGFATVGLSSTPDGTLAGKPWKVELTVFQHGRTPLDGVLPKVVIRNEQGDTEVFDAVATGKPGVYRASVVFPTAGTWNYTVDDGFVAEIQQMHDFPPVEIGAPAATTAPAADGRPWGTAILAGLATGLLVALISALTMRRRREPTAGALSPTA